jgi:hypothetical protein
VFGEAAELSQELGLAGRDARHQFGHDQLTLFPVCLPFLGFLSPQGWVDFVLVCF